MTRDEFRILQQQQVILLDGATGTELIKRGMPGGVCPEEWVLAHPEAAAAVQEEYLRAGSHIVYVPSFGANRLKLEEFGLGDQATEINRKLAELTVRNLNGRAHAFGDMAPTGQFIEPYGDLSLEDAIAVYREQAAALLEGGVSGFVVETMMDLQEARAALLAIREVCDLPVIVTMTFDQNGRTLTGCDAVCALITLQALGADAFGCNCSTGPENMLPIIAKLRDFARIPLVAKPNAGMPQLVDLHTVFDLGPEEFAAQTAAIVSAGACLVGGCCGTTPEHIRHLGEAVSKQKPLQISPRYTSVVSGTREFRVLAPEQPFAVIGERINPTGKKQLQAQLLEGDLSLVRDFAEEQTEQGAALLDVNCGMSGIDETTMLPRLVSEISSTVPTPLCIDTTDPVAAEAALRRYPGRALFNSITAERNRLDKLLPIAARYGAMLIVLPLTDAGIPDTLEGRIDALNTIFDRAATYGIRPCDCCIDPLVMTVSANPDAARLTLDTLEYASRVLHANTVCGLSNISFGLPRRELVNAAFLGMALGRGLNMAIANPAAPGIMDLARASDVLTRRDSKMTTYLSHYAATGTGAATHSSAAVDATTPADKLFQAVLHGYQEQIDELIQSALQAGLTASQLVHETLIPAITLVGDYFEKKEFFLPQLVQSADAMRRAMQILSPMLEIRDGSQSQRPRIILATVKGDIHDIGKNIVGLMLRNYGFEVIDLGKDVSAETILDTAERTRTTLIGLSALMTTTMTEMNHIIHLARERNMSHLRFIVGGAVLSENYAREIGATYAADAMQTVKIARELTH